MTRTHAALLLLLSACTAASRADVSAQPKATPKSYRAMVYSRAFAERFGFSGNGVQPLERGLQAIAFRVVERFGQPPRCLLDLYVDQELDLDYPAGDAGEMLPDDDVDPAFFLKSARAFVPSDPRWEKRRGSFQTVACKDDPKRCFVEQGSPFAFSRHLMPGIAYQTHAATCMAMDPKAAPLEVVLLRAGKESSALDVVNQSERAADVMHFRIPDALVSLVAKRAAQAAREYEKPLPPTPERGAFTVPGRE